MGSHPRDCRRCYFSQIPAVHDRFYLEAVRPYTWFAAVLLFLSYIIGLLFTLRTHAAVIWSNDIDEKKVERTASSASQLGGSMILNPHQEQGPAAAHGPHGELIRQNTSATIGASPRTDIRDTQLYKRILGQSLKQAGLSNGGELSVDRHRSNPDSEGQTPYLIPSRSREGDQHVLDNRSQRSIHINSLTEEENQTLVRQVAEMAATAAAVAARDATKNIPRKASYHGSTAPRHPSERPHAHRSPTLPDDDEVGGVETAHESAGGHDAPNWSRTKSAVILLTATVAYAVIAEILVNTVDAVLENVKIDEKFLGITLFALVPNTTEFLVSAC